MIEEKRSNGTVKWFQLIIVSLTILGIIVTVIIFVGGNFAAAMDKLDSRIGDNTKCFHSIDKRLGRIEFHMGINDK